MEPIIHFKDVTISVAEEPLLTEITFAVHTGETVGIRGASGAGKSSLILTMRISFNSYDMLKI